MKIKIDGGYAEVSPDAIREAYAELDGEHLCFVVHHSRTE